MGAWSPVGGLGKGIQCLPLCGVVVVAVEGIENAVNPDDSRECSAEPLLLVEHLLVHEDGEHVTANPQKCYLRKRARRDWRKRLNSENHPLVAECLHVQRGELWDGKPSPQLLIALDDVSVEVKLRELRVPTLLVVSDDRDTLWYLCRAQHEHAEHYERVLHSSPPVLLLFLLPALLADAGCLNRFQQPLEYVCLDDLAPADATLPVVVRTDA